MAEVFLAEDIRFKTKVAIKVLNSDFSSNSNISQRFITEARNLFRMSHPNVVRVIDLIEEEGKKAFVMEYIDGNNLRDEIERSKNVSPNDIRSWMPQMLSALGYCHSEGIVHRDIKPSNFMLNSRGQIKLLDFGIAKNVEKNVGYTPTTTTHMMGTPMYMSPEQINESKSVDYRSDIYSLGVVLWQLVTGPPPYESHILSAFQIQLKIVKDALPATGSKFDVIIQKCTAKDPKDRFQDCQEIQSTFIHIFNNDETIINSLNRNVDLIESSWLKENWRKSFFITMATFLLISYLYPFFKGSKVASNLKKNEIQDSDKDGVADNEDKCALIFGNMKEGCPDMWQGTNAKSEKCYLEKGNDGIWREGPGPEPRFQWREVKSSYDSLFFSSVDRPGYLMVLTKEKWLFKYSNRDAKYLTLAFGTWK